MKSSGLFHFLEMGGYGFYVWTSYIVAVIAIALEILAVRARVRAAMRSAAGSKRLVSVPDDTQ